MTAVSTPHPVSGLGSLCYVSVAPQTHAPLPTPPSLGDLESHGCGKEGGGKKTDEGTLLSQVLCD